MATQDVARDRHAALFAALAGIAAGIERLATNDRHSQRTELAQAEESYTAGQKGSTANTMSGAVLDYRTALLAHLAGIM